MARFINVLFVGDVVGRQGLDILKKELPSLIEKVSADMVIVNGENVTEGKGLTPQEADEIFESGCDVITTGNHIWENWKSRPLLAKNNKVIRPLNYPPGNAGLGFTYHDIDNDTKVAVLQLQGRTFMQSIDCPFRQADFAIGKIYEQTHNIIVDFHAEATAEKIGMGWHLDGRVSAIFGTHTHVPTADAQILPKGSAYISDVGMTGPYNSVVGLKKEIALKRFLLQTAHKFEMGEGDVRLCGAIVKIDADTGQAMEINTVQIPEFINKSGFEGV